MRRLMAGRAQRAKTSSAPAYDAFISYSRALDGRLAPALQSALHRFTKPWYRVRVLRVFRDDASLSANPGLWSSIEQALASSRFFVLFASPEAARSKWVTREVKYWCQHKSARNVLLALTDGKLVWDETVGDFDWDRTTALPSALAGVFDDEPRYVDLRWARTAEHLSLDDPRFRDRVADLAALLHGRAKDELFGEDVRQHRRTVRLARSAIAALAMLVVLAIAAAGVAVNRQRAAELQQRVATAGGLVAQADAARDSDPRLALMLGVAAQRIHPDGQTQASLVNTLIATNYAATLTGHSVSVSAVAFVPDGRTLATAGGDPDVILWDLADRAQPRRLGQPLRGHSLRVTAVAFAPDGRTLATGSNDRTTILWDVADRARPRRLGRRPLRGHSAEVSAVAFAPDGRTLATASNDGAMILWDLADRAQPRRLGQPLRAHSYIVGALAGLTFTPDGRTLARARSDGTVILWDLADRARPRRLGRSFGQPFTGDNTGSAAVAFAPDGRTLATASNNGTVILWDLAERAQPRRLGQPLAGHGGSVTAVAFAPDGRTLATASEDRTGILWDLADRARPRRLGQPLAGLGGSVTAVVFAPDGRTLATGGNHGTVTLLDLVELNSLRQHASERACSLTQRGLDREEWARYVPGLPYQRTCPG